MAGSIYQDRPERIAQRQGRPTDIAARRRLQHAIVKARRAGVLVKPDACEECGQKTEPRKLHAHHHNGYDEEHQLDVQWLCVHCHAMKHSASKAGRARAAKLTHEQLSAIGRMGAAATNARRSA